MGIAGGVSKRSRPSSTAPIHRVIGAVEPLPNDLPCVVNILAKSDMKVETLLHDLPLDALKRLEQVSVKYHTTPTNDTAVRCYVDNLPDMMEISAPSLMCFRSDFRNF